MEISYAITACNEHEELKKLLEFLENNIKISDEIIIQLDKNHTPEVLEVCKNHKHSVYPLNNNFAQFKNQLRTQCSKPFIFQIDADEIPHEDLVRNLPEILDLNPEIDVYLVPRINTVNGITEEHIRKWGWRVNEKQWVNYPDYQWRIYRNTPDIFWMNKVHERLYGFKEFTYLPDEEQYCLYHHKTIERQEKQNNFYNTI